MHFSKTLVFAAAVPLALGAQQSDSGKTVTPPSSADAGHVMQLPPLTVSGTVFGNYHYYGGNAGASQNGFSMDRAYLTVSGSAGERVSYRVTTDIFNNTTDGYDVRLKYGYLQYDYLRGANWNAAARVGIVQTAFIDHEENFWPRWIAKTVTDNAGWMPSADVGASTIVSMPNHWGEVYAAVTNGTGYMQTTDQDRFKDYQARVSFTPFTTNQGYLSTFALTGWYYKGALASNVAGSGASLDRDRWGIFAGVRDPRITVGLDYAESKDESNGGTATALTSSFTRGRLFSAYTTLHPFQAMNPTSATPFGIVVRYDQVKPDKDISENYSVFIGGLTWDLSKKAAIAFDYQETTPHNGITLPSIATAKAYNLHWVVKF